jgi:oligopeptide/dipeptide ABC transporter ATP-binding protein
MRDDHRDRADAQLFYQPKHPYNQALQRSIPALEQRAAISTPSRRAADVSKPIRGCPFAPRASYAQEKCVTSEIELWEVGAESPLRVSPREARRDRPDPC